MTLHPTSLAVATAVARTGSASRAAERLHLSQPAVSYHLRKLERALGASLFRRGAAGMTPTAAGERLVSGAERVLAELERIEQEVRAIGAGAPALLRLSSACFTNYHWLPAVLDELGGVRVELDVDPSRRPFERLDRGGLDIALTTVPPERGPFRIVELFDDEIVAVMPPDHPLAQRRWLTPADFSDQSVVIFDRTRSDLFSRVLEPASVTPTHVTDVPVTEALLELIRTGNGVSAMARWIVRPHLRAGTLAAVPIGREGLHRTWCAVLSDRRPVTDPVERFVEVLRRGPDGL
ncbi:MAG: LysR family transcriptional regulator [Gemmatimonadota bacterium]